MAHALLSPSSSHMWLNCPPSARLCAQFPETDTEFTRQGTDAHELCQFKLEKALGRDAEEPVLSYYDSEMEECANEYASFIMDTISEVKRDCSDPVVLIEQHLDFSKWVPEGFGRGDCVIIADGTMHVIDFKYGLGVQVSAERNPQMMCYALGAIELLDCLYDFNRVSMTIFQPRRHNVSTFVMTTAELKEWAESTLAPVAALAFEGKGEFNAGEHCRFCKARNTCKKRAEHNMELAKYDFMEPALLSPDEIAGILAKAEKLAAWVDDLKKYALEQALAGTKFDGFKIVESKTQRKYTDEDAVAKAVLEAGADPYERKLRGITAMTSLLGKKKFDQVLGSLIFLPRGKPTLVPDTDERKAMTANEFMEENI